MKFSLPLAAMVTVATVTGVVPVKTARAISFGEQSINKTQFAVVAAPYRHGYNLVILEQIPGQKQCWRETGANPTVIEPLFLNFDFTNSCVRSSDSNSYSIRFNSKDYGMDYLLNIVEQDGELHLVGTPRDSSQPEIHIGRTHGLASGSLKIILDSEWRLTKRTYKGTPTDHIYLSNSSEPQSPEQLVSQTKKSQPSFARTSSSSLPHQPETESSVNPEYIQPGQPVYPASVGNVYPVPPTYLNYPAYPVNSGYIQPGQPVYSAPVGNVYPAPPTYPNYPAYLVNPGYGYPQPTSPYPVRAVDTTDK